MPKITKSFVARLKPPTSGDPVFYRDTEVRGFALRVMPEMVEDGRLKGGTLAFILEARVKGRFRRMTIGRYPDWSVEKARALALEWKSLIAEGRDPIVEREREWNEPTFKDLAARYIEDHAKQHKSSWQRDEARIEAHFGKWANRRLSDITGGDVAKAQQEIATRHGKIASNRAMTLLRAMYNLAADWKLFAGENPAARLKFFPEVKRERFLSPDELKRVNDALMREPSEYWRAYFPLCCLLGPRKSELLSARWSDIDLAQRTWRLPTTKNGRPRLLPLPELAARVLEALPSHRVSEWVFPGAGATGHLVEVKSAWARIRKHAGVPDVTVHDLRRTLGSWLAGAGFSLPMIGKALGHTRASSTEVYARLQLDPIRTMLEANASLMFGTANPESGGE